MTDMLLPYHVHLAHVYLGSASSQYPVVSDYSDSELTASIFI